MFSILRPSLIYTDISPEITEHDEDHDAEEWSYSEKMVLRGALDTSYREHSLDVYWLYDDSLQRVGLAEHDSDDHSIFKTLWFYDTPYGTLLQEPDWKTTNTTLWSKLTPEAYQDMMDEEFEIVIGNCKGRVVIPSYIKTGFPDFYVCESCKSSKCNSEKQKIVLSNSPIFIDESYIIYTPPASSTVWQRLALQHDASEKKLELQQLHLEQTDVQLQESVEELRPHQVHLQ